MPDRRDFFSRAESMMALYRAGKYAEALNATEQLAREFPREEAATSLWRLCLLSRMGRADDALEAMSQALQRGQWWIESALRDDEDLKPMQGLPAYETMVAECKRRYTEAQKNARAELLVRLPATQPPYPLLIALHGRLGSAGGDLPRWEPIIAQGWMLAMPQSSQCGSPTAFTWDDTAKAREEVAAHYRGLVRQYPVDAERIVLGGFSQGAALSIQLALRGPIPARGFIAVVPGRWALDGLEGLARSARGLRGYLATGGQDPRNDVFAEIQSTLNRNGVPCEAEDHPEMAHDFPQAFDRTLDKALRFLFA
jgi:predicted esterase